MMRKETTIYFDDPPGHREDPIYESFDDDEVEERIISYTDEHIPMLRSTKQKKKQQTPLPGIILDRGEKVTHLYNCSDNTSGLSDRAGQEGVITVVSKRDHAVPNIYYYGLSLCSRGDNFSKKTGIAYARSRMNVNGSPFSGYIHCYRPRYNDILQMIVVDILCNSTDTLPAWVKDTLIWESHNPFRTHFMSNR